jgi:hypothetical protein
MKKRISLTFVAPQEQVRKAKLILSIYRDFMSFGLNAEKALEATANLILTPLPSQKKD